MSTPGFSGYPIFADLLRKFLPCLPLLTLLLLLEQLADHKLSPDALPLDSVLGTLQFRSLLALGLSCDVSGQPWRLFEYLTSRGIAPARGSYFSSIHCSHVHRNSF
uniref:(northern house mosquito) hypothetical protein n=1 Tax=Culex pipiens TaxID=7175 RepID=A0A8D8C7W0_CULPI